MPLRRLFLLLLLVSAGCGRRHEPHTELVISPAALTFSAPACGENPPAQKIGISVSGRSVPWSATTGFPWIQPSPQTGNVGTITEEISVTINAGLLECGKTHSGVILIEASSADNSPQSISVTVEVPTTPPPPPPPPPGGGAPVLSVTPTTIPFTAPCQATTSLEDPATLTISNAGGGTLAWSISGAPSWLEASQSSGTGNGTVTLTAKPAGLECARTFAIDLSITADGASNSPAIVRVNLEIFGPAGSVDFSASGPFGFFSSKCKSASVTPTGQTFTLTNRGGSPVSWGIDLATLPPWLSLDPSSGTIPAGGNQKVTLNLTPSSIACNTQEGKTINIVDTVAGGNPLIASFHVGLNIPSGWQFLNPKPTGNDLNDVYFINANNGWAVGAAGTILRTTDGGATWKPTASGTKNTLNAVRFASDGTTGWITATSSPSDPRVLLKTIDGGASWQEVAPILPSGWSGVDAFVGLFLNSATDGWAGGRGTDNSGRQPAIARTVDGLTWTIQTAFSGLDAGQRYEVNGIHPRLGTSEVWAAGCRGTPGSCNFGVIFRQSDGATWVLDPVSPGSWTLPSKLDLNCQKTVNDLPPFVRIVFESGSNGWIVASDPGGFSGNFGGLNGAILHFNGTAWSVETDPSDPCAGSVRLGEIPIRSIAFSGSAAWFGGGSGLPAQKGGADLSLWRFDGGTTWSDQTPAAVLPTDQDPARNFSPATFIGLAGIAFKPGSPAAVGVGDKGLLLATADASAVAWSEFDGPHVRNNLNGLAFNGSGTGVAIGDIFPCADPVNPGGCAPVIMRTIDGLTWGRLANLPLANQVMNAVSFADASNALAVGANGAVLKTPDEGSTWTSMENVASTNLKSVVMKGASLAWAVGCDLECAASTGTGKILKFTGAWSDITPAPTPPELYGLSFIDSTTGWAAGKGGKIFKTTNGGIDWISDSTGIPATAAFRAIQMLSTTEGTAVGDSSFIARYNGGSWSVELVTFAGPTRLLGIFMLNPGTGWTVGTSGAIARRNGSSAWSADDSGTNRTLRSVFFQDAFNGWVVGDAGTILSTATGGNLP